MHLKRNILLLVRTIRHLSIRQIFYQAKYRLIRSAYVPRKAPQYNIPKLKTHPIPKFLCLEGEIFTFLNLTHLFAGWNFTEHGMLWAYNQNYFDWLIQGNITYEKGSKWIDRFINELPNNKIGLDSYPIALRSINWIKFFCKYPETATKVRLDSLYSQLKLLENKLEFHLCGNHLLEDAYALYIGGSFFSDEVLLKRATKLLLAQLQEHILPDGAHYEQSPMYHCILLDRLLDCINIRTIPELEEYAIRMLGHLESITWTDGCIPLLNDSANGIAPTPAQLFDYAKRLGLKWEPIPLKECGYRKMTNSRMEAIVDVGDITATYQPGHTHADTFNYELLMNGKPFIVDTGISTYNKTKRRQLERSTIAHNCVAAEGKDSSEVWGSFRVGRRCHVDITTDTETIIEAIHNGFTKSYTRRFEMTKDGFSVEDWFEGEAVSYIHLAEDANEKHIKIEHAIDIDVKLWQYSTEYNQFHEGKVIEIRFRGHCKYTIQ